VAIKLHNVQQGSNGWIQLRADLYTGQNAQLLLNFHDHIKIINGVASAYALNEITGFNGNFYTKRGHLLEDEAIDLYQQITKSEGIRFEGGDKVGFVTNTKFPTCGYSPDDIYPDHTLEVKAFKEKLHLQLIEGKIPMKILAQIHFGLLICEKQFCDFIPYNPRFAKKYIDGEPNKSYDPKLAFKIIRINRNPRIAANFKRILTKQPQGAY
jgi:hypothetical protein